MTARDWLADRLPEWAHPLACPSCRWARRYELTARQRRIRRDLRDLAIAQGIALLAGLSGLWWLPWAVRAAFGGGAGG